MVTLAECPRTVKKTSWLGRSICALLSWFCCMTLSGLYNFSVNCSHMAVALQCFDVLMQQISFLCTYIQPQLDEAETAQEAIKMVRTTKALCVREKSKLYCT